MRRSGESLGHAIKGGVILSAKERIDGDRGSLPLASLSANRQRCGRQIRHLVDVARPPSSWAAERQR
jgi:hypothetical protein